MGHVTNELLSLHEPWQVLIKLACLYNEHALAVEVLDRQVDHPTLVQSYYILGVLFSFSWCFFVSYIPKYL